MNNIVAPNNDFTLMMNAILMVSALIGVGLVYALSLVNRRREG